MVQLAGVAAMVLVIVVVVLRLPKIEVGHVPGYKRRRALNWLPIGLAYAFMYMARYNLNTLNKMGFIEPTGLQRHQHRLRHHLRRLVHHQRAADRSLRRQNHHPPRRHRRRRGQLRDGPHGPQTPGRAGREGHAPHARDDRRFRGDVGLEHLSQSFGAVAIVKINAPWFDIRERGTFGAIFGILISIGLWLAFDWTQFIAWLHADPLGAASRPRCCWWCSRCGSRSS